MKRLLGLRHGVLNHVNVLSLKENMKTATKKEKPLGFRFDEGTHKYFMDGKPMTGCTTILGVLNKPALVPWAARMAVDYVKDVWDIDTAHTKEWFLNEVYEAAKNAHAKKRDEGAAKGTDTHALVETYIKFAIKALDGQAFLTPEVPSEVVPFAKWATKENIRFVASEQKLYSKSLWIAGTADFIFEKDGKRYIGDIKTYKKIWDRTPFYQCAGYALMWEEMQNGEPITDDTLLTGKQLVDGYVVFNLPKERAFDESQDVLWSFDIEGDTRAFKACVEIYRQNANFKPNYSKK